MRRREILAGLVLPAVLAGCAGTTPDRPRPAASSGGGPAPVRGGGEATAADYAWMDGGSRLSEVYCLTWVEGLSPEAVADRLGGRIIGKHRWPDGAWNHVPGLGRDETVLAVTRIAGWSLVVEDAGPIGIDDHLVRRLSKGSRLVATYYNFEADGRFVLAEDGVVQVDFDPRAAAERSGARPDLLAAAMRATGLDPAGPDVPPDEAALALAERVTGIALTAGLLHSATYLAVAMPDSSGDAVRDVTDIRTAGL